MKILKNHIILNLLILFLLGGSVILSYYSHDAYQQQKASYNKANLSPLLNKLKSLLEKIDDERLKSANYMAMHTRSKFVQLNKIREQVDQSFLELNTYVKKIDLVHQHSISIKNIHKALQQVREKVDSLNSDYRDILFKGYHSDVFIPFSNMISELTFDQDSADLKQYLLSYGEIIALKENTVLENSGITFILLKQSKLQDEDRIIWDQVIAKDKLPKFDKIPDKGIAADIRRLFSANAYENILEEERKKILEESKSNGTYTVAMVDWLEKIIKKTDYLNQVLSIIQSNIKHIDETNASKIEKKLIVYIVGLLLFLFLLYKLLAIRSKQMKNKKIYEETRRNIELIFDKGEQKKLKRLIENGQVDLIYKFLIKAIGDANQTKDLFLASMSHEIRTPLNGILGFTQLLKETEITEEQHEFISIIEKSSEHLLRIVNDILDLSKIKAQKIELESINFDPIESFENAIESYSAKAIKENIDFNIFLDPKLPTLLTGDPTKISQVIVNLVSNAIKFTSKNGEIYVSIEKISENDHEARVKFSVTDNGIGISEEQQKKIFDAFSQADISTSRKYGGTGLGLSISGKLIDLMGGKLYIKSVKDEGSTFYFTLALKKPKEASRRIVEDMRAYTVGILNSHIDTNYYINENLEAYITYTGAKIKRYTDETLLEIKDKKKLPDILFIDHKFRQRGGELEKFLKIDTRIIVISTSDQKRNLKHYLTDIDKILYKPVTYTKTIKILSRHEESIEKNNEQVMFSNVHVLVAEDNLINQKLIINVLNRIGVKVSIANNGQEAYEQRIREKYDMILMDIEMPVMGGIEATGKILSYERSNAKKHIPIIALTANALTGDKEKYIAAGMDGYLPKPLELDALRDIFKEYFEDRIR